MDFSNKEQKDMLGKVSKLLNASIEELKFKRIPKLSATYYWYEKGKNTVIVSDNGTYFVDIYSTSYDYEELLEKFQIGMRNGTIDSLEYYLQILKCGDPFYENIIIKLINNINSKTEQEKIRFLEELNSNIDMIPKICKEIIYKSDSIERTLNDVEVLEEIFNKYDKLLGKNNI